MTFRDNLSRPEEGPNPDVLYRVVPPDPGPEEPVASYSPHWLRFDQADWGVAFDGQRILAVKLPESRNPAGGTPLDQAAGALSEDYRERLRAFLRRPNLDPRNSGPIPHTHPVDGASLRQWADVPPIQRCRSCWGRGYLLPSEVSCPVCREERMVGHGMDPGMVNGVTVNRRLFAGVVHALPGSVILVLTRPQHRWPVWMEGDDWRLVVMPLREPPEDQEAPELPLGLSVSDPG